MAPLFLHQILSLCDTQLSACPLGELSFSIREESLCGLRRLAIPSSPFPFSDLSV